MMLAILIFILLHVIYVCEWISPILFIVFMILKLTAAISWSWICVFIPLLTIPILIMLHIGLMYLIAYLNQI